VIPNPSPSETPSVTNPAIPDTIARLRDNILRVFLGNEGAVDRVICCLLARGHVLIEDVPGVGKTVLATALAKSIDCKFSRIQLTSDMLPGDVLGVSIFDRTTGEFTLKRGPIFTNILLADEINRTTPRTQTALLEAMNEAQVSIDGTIIPLGAPFMVLATQNPYEFEGTYLLPENQLDRVMLHADLGIVPGELLGSDLAAFELPIAHGLKPRGNTLDHEVEKDVIVHVRSLVPGANLQIGKSAKFHRDPVNLKSKHPAA